MKTVNEKTRQLRATYALQCSDLRSRIERRVNRVPISMRSMKMGELIAQQQGSPVKASAPRLPNKSPLRSPAKPRLEERPLPALPSPSKLPSPTRNQMPHSQKMRKRKSSAIRIPSDKENHEPENTTPGTDDASFGKSLKRVKTAEESTSQPKRTASRVVRKPVKTQANTTGVLSPRSHNSRTLPRSPIKEKELPPPMPVRDLSPVRQDSPTRPTSPSKSHSPFKTAMTGAGSAISAMAKRGYAAAGAAGARLARPLSREKELNTLSGLGPTVSASPSGKMLPPPRPANATATLPHANASTSSIPMLSPQRTASQASMRSQASQQSSTSSNNTVVKKSTRTVVPKKSGLLNRSATTRAPTLSTAAQAKSKVVLSSSTSSTLSPKASTHRKPPVPSLKKVQATTTVKKVTATSATGRVLRKRG